jgi:hypothetical protein
VTGTVALLLAGATAGAVVQLHHRLGDAEAVLRLRLVNVELELERLEQRMTESERTWPSLRLQREGASS